MPKKKVSKGAQKKQQKKVVVTLADSHMPKIKDVATKLRAKGMKIESILDKTGQITGSYAKPAAELKTVEGVLDAEEQPVFQLPPPGSDVQ